MAENAGGRYPCDMHCHTLRSDGNDTPRELIDNAARIGLAAVGITDHDITPPVTLALDGDVRMLSIVYGASKGVRLVLGYEFSCDTNVDDVHICGYNMDWAHPDLLEEVEAAKRSKTNAYEELTKLLTEKGMRVDWEEHVLNYTAPGGTPAVRAPGEVQRKHIFEAMEALGHAATWSDAKIMVRDDPGLNIRRRKIDPGEAIALIHKCGGIAILAHPYLIDEIIRTPGNDERTRDEYIEELISAGLDGIEAAYTYDKTSYKGTMTPEEIEAEVRRKYTGRVKYISGGSDYHAGHKKGSKKVRYLGERGISLAEFQAMFGE